MDNQKVVRNDAERTKLPSEAMKEPLEVMLTYYCKEANMKYK